MKAARLDFSLADFQALFQLPDGYTLHYVGYNATGDRIHFLVTSDALPDTPSSDEHPLAYEDLPRMVLIAHVETVPDASDYRKITITPELQPVTTVD